MFHGYIMFYHFKTTVVVNKIHIYFFSKKNLISSKKIGMYENFIHPYFIE
jgi:hypothetical protein